MFERFTRAAREVVVSAVSTAADLGAAKVGPQHLLVSLAAAGDGVAVRVLAGYGVTEATLRATLSDARRRAGLTEQEMAALRSVGVDADEVFRRIEEAFGPDALAATSPPRRGWRGRLGSPFEPSAKKVLELSLREAIALQHRYIGAEHILLALLRAGVPAPADAALSARGITYDDVKAKLLAELSRAG